MCDVSCHPTELTITPLVIPREKTASSSTGLTWPVSIGLPSPSQVHWHRVTVTVVLSRPWLCPGPSMMLSGTHSQSLTPSLSHTRTLSLRSSASMALSLSTATAFPTPASSLLRFLPCPVPKPLTIAAPARKRSFFVSSALRVAAPTTHPSISEGFDAIADDESSGDALSLRFRWRDHWYPVSLIEDLDPSVPTPFQLLGRDIVIWFDPSRAQWAAFDDKCPHRLAPLSEGRIDEDGNLQCSYHGWSFDGCGSCTRIPQAAPEGPEARAIRSPRAGAIKLPTVVSQGLLFVWPDENSRERSLITRPPMLPDDFDKPEFSTVTIQRDLFYGYDTLMENVSDPSHIDFAHHKVTGRRDRAKPLPFKMDSSGLWGFAGSNDGNPKISAKFVAPCYYMNKIEIDAKLPIVGDQKWIIWICSFNVPMAPGKTRSIVCSARNFFQFTMPGSAWWQVVPRWHEHWTSNKVYDGDMIVLQGQEKVFLSKSVDGSANVNEEYTKLTFTPTQADRFVLAFRNWLRVHGNNQPDWFGISNRQPLPSTILSKRQMLDRYEQHTLKCASCREAYTTFQALQKFLLGAAAVCCSTAGIPAELLFRIILGGLALALFSFCRLGSGGRAAARRRQKIGRAGRENVLRNWGRPIQRQSNRNMRQTRRIHRGRLGRGWISAQMPQTAAHTT